MLLAIDPATLCGFACENGKRGTWRLKKRGWNSPLLRMEHVLERGIREWGVNSIVTENAAGGSWQGSGGNVKTQAFHNQLLGVIKLVAARHAIPLLVLWPATIKAFATGKAFANKSMMRQALRLHYWDEYSDKLDDNAIDAIWILKYAQANPYGPPKRKRKTKKKPRKQRAPQPGLLPF